MKRARIEVEKRPTDDSEEYVVCVSMLNGDTICEVRVDSACTVGELKHNIEVITHVPMREQQLSSSGELLRDENVLLGYMVSNVTLAVMLTVRPCTNEEIQTKRKSWRNWLEIESWMV